MKRLFALLFVLLCATACAGRGGAPLASPAADNLAREPVSHLQRSIIRSNSRITPTTEPASHKPQSKQDVQRLYRTYRKNGGRLLLTITPQTGRQLTQEAVHTALEPDFDALYLLFKAAPDSLLRIQANAPENAPVSAHTMASQLMRSLQQSCNLTAERCSIQARTSPHNKRGEVRILVTAPHVPSQLTADVAAPAVPRAAPRPTAQAVASSPEAGEVAVTDAPRANLQDGGKDVTFYFNSGRAGLEPGMAEQIARIAAQLKADPDLRIRIEGFSDNVGNGEANRLLSYQRALAVQIELIARHGLSAQRLDVIGLGESQPLGDNSTPAGRRLNRRVEVHVLAPQPRPANSQRPVAGQSAQTGVSLARNHTHQPAQHVTSTPLPRSSRVSTADNAIDAVSSTTIKERGSASPADIAARDAAPKQAAASAVAPGGPDPAARFNLRMGASAVRGHFVGTNLAPTYAKVPLARATYAPLPQQPRKYRIEVSISKCTLWLYEIMADGSKRLVRPFQVATAKPGTSWPKGEGRITGIDHSPWWYPTQNMKRRARKIGKRLVPVPPGSPSNPMGAVKIMLSHMNNGGAYRIHGTNQPWLIGKRVSLGCIRMRNEDSLELARLAPVGTVVDIQY